MADGRSDLAVVGVVAGGLALCCGFSAVVSAGLIGIFAGLGFNSWVLLGVGVVVLVTGLLGLRSNSRECVTREPEAVEDHSQMDS